MKNIKLKFINLFQKSFKIVEKDLLLFKEHFGDDLMTYAASLSYYSVFALIPLCLIIFSILLNMPNFAGDVANIKNLLLSTLIPTNADVISSYLDKFMENSSSLGMMGLGYALFASFMFFRSYQYVALKMFQNEANPRSFFDSLIVYWCMITLFPIAFAFSIYFSGEVQKVLKDTADLSIIWNLIPYFITWLLFFLLFKISANKKLNLLPLMISSIGTTIAWLMLKWGFVLYVFHNQTYKSIYGSVSIILFLLLWIYLSWIVLLYGMRSYEFANSRFTKDGENVTI